MLTLAAKYHKVQPCMIIALGELNYFYSAMLCRARK